MVPALIWQTRSFSRISITKVLAMDIQIQTVTNWTRILLTVSQVMKVKFILRTVVRVWMSRTSKLFWVVPSTKIWSRLVLVTWITETRRSRIRTRMLNPKAKAWAVSLASTIKLRPFSTAKIISSKINRNFLLSMARVILLVASQVMAVLVQRVMDHLLMVVHMVKSIFQISKIQSGS